MIYKGLTYRFGGGGGGGGSPPPPAIPPGPTAWLYDRSGNPVKLVTIGTYSRVGDPQDGNFQLTTQDMSNPIAGDINGRYDDLAANGSNTLYRSAEAAQAANPQMWLYDDKGNTTRQIFNSDFQAATAAGTQSTLLKDGENFGPSNTPFQHIYDEFGVDQGYQPVSTGVPTGMYSASNQAPLSPDYNAPVSLTQTDPALQAGVGQASPDIAAAKTQSQTRSNQSAAAALLASQQPSDPNATTGGTGGNKTLVGD